MKHNAVVPDHSSKLSKKEQVAGMFNDIAGKYDFLNHALSMGIDKGWRKKAIKSIESVQPRRILDIATGTGDLALAAAAYYPDSVVTGLDIASQMLAMGTEKIKARNLQERIHMELGDSEQIAHGDHSFDAVLCAYGTRNFQDLEKGLSEMCRVLKPGGRVAILEFSHPRNFPVKQVFGFYFKYVLPFLGRVISRHSTAYTYLPESVMAFPEGAAFCDIMRACGFSDVSARPLTFGITSLYTGVKP
ncbi:bifunctional demethylmenaquinone methyltransferase/2-methoxy-6-polyprenyl-1,4-benzoquinol methylase UbiE [Rurimicrobium arvi]|uniref:Demethylmenaquinone methyltransferase n=1 Tax=Rurimicrobium arvi TaxID=2049916 RepID=A0ABP8MLP2_9BACT